MSENISQKSQKSLDVFAHEQPLLTFITSLALLVEQKV